VEGASAPGIGVVLLLSELQPLQLVAVVCRVGPEEQREEGRRRRRRRRRGCGCGRARGGSGRE
jgi:hypothetical protein